MTEGALHIERWRIPLGDVLSLHLDGSDMARLIEARVVGNSLVIDMEGDPHAGKQAMAPKGAEQQTPEPFRGDDGGKPETIEPAPSRGDGAHDSDETADQDPPAPDGPPSPELKGGPLARQAAIICSEGAFNAFLQTEKNVMPDPDVGYMLCTYLGITSRRMLDHDPAAAQRWRELKEQYDLWMAMP